MAGGLNRNITVRLLADTSKFTAGMAKVSAEAEKTSTTMEASGGKTKLLTTGIAAASARSSAASRRYPTGSCPVSGGAASRSRTGTNACSDHAAWTAPPRS